MAEHRPGRLIERIWYSPSTLGERLSALALEPLSWAYRLGLAMRGSEKPVEIGRPVISVGNLTVGGNGKTPLVIELAGMLERQGKKVAVVSRGYGRTSSGVIALNELPAESLRASKVGDEPLLILRRCPNAAVVVGEDRVAAARQAVERFDPDVIICDDAFQHRRLHRDLNLCAIHAQRGFGNRRLLPSGPLREPLGALKRADMLIFSYAAGRQTENLRSKHAVPEDIPACACDFTSTGFCRGPELIDAEHPGQQPVLAVSAVAAPAQFLQTCNQAGLNVVGSSAFPDHHRIGARELDMIASDCRSLGARTVVCTEKDLVRIEQDNTEPYFIGLRLAVRWEGRRVLDELLESRLDSRHR